MKWLRRALAGVLILSGLSWSAARALFPGVPFKALLRPTRTTQVWAELAETARAIRGQHGYVAAFAPNENYFSGRDGRVLYLGRKRQLSAKLAVVAGEALPAFRVAAFLDYRPVALRVRRADDRRWATAQTFEGALEPAREATWEIALDDVPPGTSELALVLDSGKRLIESADPDTARPMLNRHILVYRLQRGEGRATPPSTTSPTVQKAQHCERNEKVLLVRGDQVAVINCTHAPTSGVLFGSEISPLFYASPADSLVLFTTESTRELLHITRRDGEAAPPIEDSLGS